MDDTYQKWLWEKQGIKCVEALKKHDFDAHFAHSTKDAKKLILEMVSGYDTPCAKTGFCSDCNAPKRLCRVTTILHRKPFMTDISVVLVNEALGF